jgi:methionyl-tRNA formyltransferase
LIRAQSDPTLKAFTFYRSERIRILRASVSQSRYGGTPGHVFIREGDGVVIVAGAEARRGHNHGLAIKRVRTDDDSEYTATEYFRIMGGYLTSHP